jgi:hypothetical protein
MARGERVRGPAKRPIDFHWPLRGVHKRYAYSGQPPFSTPEARNVRPDQTLEGRAPGGSRPGLGKAFYTQIGSGNPIRLVNSVTYVRSDGFDHWADQFKGTALGTEWSTASWVGTPPEILPKDNASVSYNAEVGAVRSALSGLDTASQYEIAIFISSWAGQFSGDYRIYARMDNGTPDLETDGVVAELVMNDDTGDYTGSLRVYASGVLTDTYNFTPGSLSAVKPGWFKINVNGNDITCYWQEATVLAATTVSAAAGARFGFGMECTVDGGRTLIDTFSIEYYRTGDNEEAGTILVASSNGELWYSTWQDTLVQLSTNLSLDADRQIEAVDYLQKLYIADWAPPIATNTAGTGTVSGDQLSDAAIADFTALGGNIYDYVVVTSNGSGPTDDTYEILAITSGYVQLASSPGDGTCDYRLERAPKIFDPAAGTLTLWTATAGQVPSGCRSIAVFQDRIKLGGSMDNPYVWYDCRKGDPLDFDYSVVNDNERAVGGPNSIGGNVGQPIKAIITHANDYIIIAGHTQLKIMRGDPMYNATFSTLSPNVGCIDVKTWCLGPGGEVIMLTRDGLYIIPPDVAAKPVSISRELLPDELLDADSNLFTILMEYDIRFRGVHIYMTPVEDRARTHWWFSWEGKAFWSDKYDTTDHEPTAIFNYTADIGESSAVLLGCKDGYIRRHRRVNETDDGTEIDSYVMIGPLRLWDEWHDGILAELDATLSEGSGQVTCTLLVGDSHEAAVTDTALWTKTWSVGTNGGRCPTWRPRARGASLIARLANGATDRRWGIDRLVGKAERAGRHR